jgi:hypothetical protein
MNNSTSPHQLDFYKFVYPVATMGELIAVMVQHYSTLFRNYAPRESVASLVGTSYKELCAMMANERPIKLSVFCNISRVCCYPEAFQILRDMNFPQSIPVKGTIK